MTNPIVHVNVSQEVAPTPSLLQKKGALVSQGGTVTTPGTRSPLTQLSDLTPLLTPAKAIASLSFSAGTVTANTVDPHGFTVGDTIPLTIADAVPTEYNGSFNASITGPSAFTYPLSGSPGSETSPGTYVPQEVASLTQRARTFFAQGSAQAVDVLEEGAGDADDGVAFLDDWITANPGVYYGYVVPRYWDANASFLALVAGFENPESMTYFWVTTTLNTYASYAGIKSVLWLIEAPVYGVWPANTLTNISWAAGVVTATTQTDHGVSPGDWFQIAGVTPSGYNGWQLAQPGTEGDTLVYDLANDPGVETVLGSLLQSQYEASGITANEFSIAAPFRVTLNYAPSSTNKVTPLNYAFLFGVTSFPTQGNNALINTLLDADGNLIGTGAQGGISATLLLGGKTADGNPFKYWYSVDWVQITLSQALTAALINGANNPVNPVDYNQAGINTLQQAAVATMSQGQANGLVLNAIKVTTLSAAEFQIALAAGAFVGYTVVNAEPFGAYTAANPTHYAAGIYNGLTVRYSPLRGFESITVNVTVSSFAG